MIPCFTIIIPVYNVAPYLRECLDSVLNQTFSNWEAICVDDGSTDGSGDILNEYAVRDSRFHVIHKENGGVSSARNAALDVAQGEWILFLDGDDLISLELLECLNKSSANKEADIIVFEVVKFSEGKSCIPCPKGGPSCLIDVSQRISEVGLFSYFFCKAYLRSLFGPIRFNENISNHEDGLYLLECLMLAKKLLKIYFPGYWYRKRVGSATNSSSNYKPLLDYTFLAPRYFSILTQSGKIVPHSLYSAKICRFTQMYIMWLLQNPPSARTVLWARWFEMVRKCKQFRGFPFWHRFVLNACAFSRSKIVAIILCGMIFRIKQFCLIILKKR